MAAICAALYFLGSPSLVAAANVTMPQDPNFDSITFTVVTQILPLLALFGQDLTNDYLSQTVDWMDYIIFAVGPLGVGWAIIASIRAMGPKWLKARIGKTSESDALIERDLMSSTSDNVCELWDGEKVVRETRRGKIKEFLLLDGEIWKPDDGRNRYFDTDPEKKWTSDFDLQKAKGLSPSSPLPAYEERTKKARPPNLSLNLGPHNRERFSLLAVIAASIFQLAFLALLASLTYDSYLSGHFTIPTYTFLCATVGTVLLSLGLVLGARGINKASTKIIWKRLPGYVGKCYILWVQRGIDGEDGKYSSHVFLKEIYDEILESHYRQSFTRTLQIGSFSVLTVSCIIAGYVLQVIGVTGMHYPAQLTLFGITIIMTGVRVMLRPTPHALQSHQTHLNHEMDWLAVTQLLRPDDLTTSGGNHDPAPTWTVNGGQAWDSSSNTQKDPSINTTDLIYLRNKIGNECDWDSPGKDQALSAVRAIESIARRLAERYKIEDSSIQCHVPVDLGSKLKMENFTFSVETDGEKGNESDNRKNWTLAGKDNIVSAMSLWLFYDKENDPNQKREDDLSIFFLGSYGLLEKVRRLWIRPREVDSRMHLGFERVRSVRLAETGPRRNRRPQSVNVRRNMIAGFQDKFDLNPPNYYYNRHRATVQLDIDTHDFSVRFADIDLTDTPKTEYENSAAAIVETTNIAKLYARHLVSAFMWAVAQRLPPEKIELHKTENQHFLWELANEIAVDAPLNTEDALLLILLPLLDRAQPKSNIGLAGMVRHLSDLTVIGV